VQTVIYKKSPTAFDSGAFFLDKRLTEINHDTSHIVLCCITGEFMQQLFFAFGFEIKRQIVLTLGTLHPKILGASLRG